MRDLVVPGFDNAHGEKRVGSEAQKIRHLNQQASAWRLDR
jgi:hypothetical protein